MTSEHRLSFEFFPPKTEAGFAKLGEARKALAVFSPDFFSVTYGAGGSTRDNTFNVVATGVEAGASIAPHLSFGGDDESSIESLVKDYIDMGVVRIVALRGDLPSGFGDGSRLVHANELVRFLRSKFSGQLQIEVAAYPEIHPEASSYEEDVSYLKLKFDAGADSAITQYFYNIQAYEEFLEVCEKKGINKPIYPGIMPITNFENLQRFSKNCGAEIPRWLEKRINSFKDIESVRAFSTDYISRFCEQLIALGAPGLHFYTMNQIEPNASICRNLGRWYVLCGLSLILNFRSDF